MKRFVLIIILFAFTLFSFTSNQAQAAQKVVFSIGQNPNDPIVKTAEKNFREFIAKKTGGKYEIDVYPGSQLGNIDSIFQGLQFNTIQLALDTTSNLSAYVPELAVFDVPFLMPNEKAIRKVTDTPFAQAALQYIDKAGVQPIALILSTPRAIVSTFPLTSVDDIHGQKMRTTTSKIHAAAIRALGFNPTPIPITEMLTSLQQKVIDALDGETGAIYTWRYCDVAKNLFISEYIPVVWVLFASKEWWNSLPDEDKKIFDEGFNIYKNEYTKLMQKEVDEALRIVEQDYGVKITRLNDEQKKPFIERTKGVYDELSKEQKILADKIRQEVSQ